MKHIYFQVIDISKQSNSLEFAYFGASPICYDIAGYVTDMARRNNSSIIYDYLFLRPKKNGVRQKQNG